MNISDRLEGARTTEPLKPQSPALRDLGVQVLDDHLGGCLRQAWYKFHGQPETNPRRDRLNRADRVDQAIRQLYLESLRKVVRVVKEMAGWQVPFGNEAFEGTVHSLVAEGEGHYAVMIRSGGGFAFRNEVFGTKSGPGSIKDLDLVEAWAILTFYPTALDRVEVVYVDRGLMDDVTHVIKPPAPIPREVLLEFMQAAAAQALAPCSYEKQWTSLERVARLYANKKITKEKYMTFKETGDGMDWQCAYCPFLQRCINDDRVL